jgi:hypothetical protein
MFHAVTEKCPNAPGVLSATAGATGPRSQVCCAQPVGRPAKTSRRTPHRATSAVRLGYQVAGVGSASMGSSQDLWMKIF